MEPKKNCGCGKDPCITYGAELVTPKFKGHDKCLECGNIEVPVSEMDGGEIGLTDYYFSCADCDFSWYVSVKTDEHEDGERAYVSNEVGFIDEDGNIHQEPQEFNIMGQPNLVYEKYQEWDSLMDAESNGANDDISLMMSIIDEIEANDIWNETINEMIRRGKAVRRPDGKVIFSDRVPQFDIIEDIAQYTTPEIKSAENSDHWMTFGRVDYNWVTDPEDLELTDENFSIIDAHIRDEVRYVIDNDADNSSGESNLSSGDLNLTQEDEDEFTIYYYWGSPFTTGVNSAESFEAQSTKRPQPNTSLKGADLSGYDLTGANLRNANLNHTDMRDADLNGVKLLRARMRNADLRQTFLRGASLEDADLNGVDLRNANLTGANLSNADLYGAYLSNADLSNANLRNANMSGVKKAEELSSFTSKELTESSAIHGDFDHASINYSGHQNLEVLDAEENIALADPSFWMNYPITSMLATAGIFAIGKTLLNSRKGDI